MAARDPYLNYFHAPNHTDTRNATWDERGPSDIQSNAATRAESGPPSGAGSRPDGGSRPGLQRRRSILVDPEENPKARAERRRSRSASQVRIKEPNHSDEGSGEDLVDGWYVHHRDGKVEFVPEKKGKAGQPRRRKPDLENKTSPRNRQFREKRDGYESAEGETLKKEQGSDGPSSRSQGDRGGTDRGQSERSRDDRGPYDRRPNDKGQYDRAQYDRGRYDRGQYDREPYDRGKYDRRQYDRGLNERGRDDRGLDDRRQSDRRRDDRGPREMPQRERSRPREGSRGRDRSPDGHELAAGGITGAVTGAMAGLAHKHEKRGSRDRGMPRDRGEERRNQEQYSPRRRAYSSERSPRRSKGPPPRYYDDEYLDRDRYSNDKRGSRRPRSYNGSSSQRDNDRDRRSGGKSKGHWTNQAGDMIQTQALPLIKEHGKKMLKKEFERFMANKGLK